MRFRIIEDCRDDYPVRVLCEALEVSPSGYYVRWSPFPGQFRGWDKLGSGPCHAANLIRSDVPW